MSALPSSSKARERSIQYPWGTVCPLHWPKAYVAIRWDDIPSETTLSGIIRTLAPICPDIEWSAQNVLLLDIKKVQRLYSSPMRIAKALKQVLPKEYQTNAQIGLADNEWMACFATYITLPEQHEIQIIPAWDSASLLNTLSIEQLEPMVQGVTEFFGAYGLKCLEQIKTLPRSLIESRFGKTTKVLLMLSQGKPIPSQYWNTLPPKQFSKGQRSNRAKKMTQSALESIKLELLNALQDRQLKSDDWSLEYQPLQQDTLQALSTKSESATQVLTQPFGDMGDLESLCFRWVVNNIRTNKAQRELFADWVMQECANEQANQHLSYLATH